MGLFWPRMRMAGRKHGRVIFWTNIYITNSMDGKGGTTRLGRKRKLERSKSEACLRRGVKQSRCTWKSGVSFPCLA